MKKRRLGPPLFASEADLCAAFIAWASRHGLACYPEWQGWDILVAFPTGEQIGIQAKLRLSDEVMLQALPGHHQRPEDSAPDFRAILVPESSPVRHDIAYRLGLIAFEPKMDWCPEGPMTEEFLGNFRPQLTPEGWRNWKPIKRHDLPATPTDSIAGSPSPITLTAWKLKALDVVAHLEVSGRITAKQIEAIGCAAGRWTQMRWVEPIEGERGFWVRGAKCPPFEKQHPSAYAVALEKARAASVVSVEEISNG